MNITYPINALPRAIPLCLGVQSEYGARPISIDVSAWVGRWPDIIVSVQPVRPGEDVSYPAAGVTRSGNIVTWTPNSYDTEIPGTGSVEIIGLADGVKIIRTGAATTIAPTKSSVSKTPEDPIAAWADSVIRAGEQAKAGAEEALLLAQAANKSANNANTSAVQAQSSQRAAATSASQAATYRTDAVNAMNAAKNSQTQAKTSEQSASASATAAYKSQTKAEAAAKRAEEAANSMGGGGTVSPGDGKLKADAIICSVSGESVSISDASERDALSVVSHISAPEGVTGITLTRAGRNIFGGMALAHSIVNQAAGSVLDMDAKTVTYTAPAIKGVNVFDKFEPGKRYTIIFRRDESASKGTTANIRIIYDNGDAANISFSSGNTAVVTTAANKNVEKLLGYNSSGPTCLLYEQCGIFEGVLTEADFVPYEAETFTVALPEPVTDGTFDWTTGVLTINQDGASRTEQLDAQPIAMQDGYNTLWSSTGQTDVRYVADTKAYVDGHGADADAEYADNAGYAEEAGDAQTVKGRDIAAEVDALSEEIVKSVTLSGNCITCDVPEDTRISLSSETDDSVTLVHIGKNFLPRPIDNQPSKSQNGITGTANEDGSLTLVGTCTGHYSFYLMHSAFGTEYIFPAGTYCVTMSYDGDYTPVSNAVEISLAIQKKGSDGTYTMVSNPVASAKFTSFTLEEPSVLRVWVGVGKNVYTNAVWRFQIDRKGDAEFEPYKRTVYTNTSFPTQIEAYQGVNNFYTESGDMLTAEYTPSEKAAILEEVKKLLKNYATPGTDFTTVKTLVLGDSISTDYYGNYNKWVTVLINSGFFSPVNVNNSSVHATGFVARKGDEANDFISRVTALTDKDTYDLVVVFGGINDYIQSIPMGEAGGDILTEFKPAVDYFFDYMIKNFTQARIVVLSPLRISGGETQAQYSDYIKQVAKSYSLPVLNLTDESGFCPSVVAFKNRWTLTEYEGGDGVTGDGVHPNEEYERRFLAPMIRAFLQSVM